MQKYTIISLVILSAFICTLSHVSCSSDNDEAFLGRDISYPSDDAYFRENVAGTGVADSPGPTGFLRIRFTLKKFSNTTESTVALSKGTLFCEGSSSEAGSGNRYVYAIDEYSGDVQWKFEIDRLANKKYSWSSDPYIRNSCHISDNFIFFSDFQGKLYCVDKSTGKAIWRTQASSVGRSSAIAHDGRVFIGGADFYCLDQKTGKILWTWKGPNWGVKGSAAYYDGKVIFGAYRGTVHALDAKTGKQIWELKSDLGGEIYSSPAVARDTVCIGIGPFLYAIDVVTGKKKWDYRAGPGKDGNLVGSSPAIWDDHVYFIYWSDPSICYCLDLRTGKLVWKYTLAKSTGILSSPVISNGKIYLGDENGTVHALNAKDGKVVFKFEVGKSITSSITIHDHALFFTADEDIICLEDRRCNPLAIKTATRYSQIVASQKKNEAQISVLVEKLGSEKAAERESARKELHKMGLTAYPLLQAGTKSSEAEISDACATLIKKIEKEVSAFEFIKKQGFGESSEYFLTVLKTCRTVFVKQCIEALARITGKKFKGDFADIETARKAAFTQYSAPVPEPAGKTDK